MSANADKIRVSPWLEREIYERMHERSRLTNATHQEIIEIALQFYLDNVKISVTRSTRVGL